MQAPHRGFFDLWSLFYDFPAVQRATYHPVHDAVVEALRRRPPGAVLDVACGTRVLAPGGRALIALVNPRSALLSDLTAFGSRFLGEPFYWPTSGGFRRALASAGFRTLSQRPVGRLPGALLFPAVLSVAQKRA